MKNEKGEVESPVLPTWAYCRRCDLNLNHPERLCQWARDGLGPGYANSAPVPKDGQ